MVLTIGIDFDNTLANYSGVFYQVGVELGWLPENIGKSKSSVKQYFFDQNQHDKWTELQGVVYGNEIHRAQLYQGAKEVIGQWLNKGHTVYIISHKTQYPVIGERVSLHDAATKWLKTNEIIGVEQQLLESQVFFNQTQEDKIAKVIELGCNLFIDDLPAIFQHTDFPSNVKKVFFDPDNHFQEVNFADFHFNSWQQIADAFND